MLRLCIRIFEYSNIFPQIKIILSNSWQSDVIVIAFQYTYTILVYNIDKRLTLTINGGHHNGGAYR